MAEWRQTVGGRCKEYVVRTPEYMAKVMLSPLCVRLSINVRDEEDDGNAIDMRISRKMISNTRELLNSYIFMANIRYQVDIPNFEPPKGE